MKNHRLIDTKENKCVCSGDIAKVLEDFKARHYPPEIKLVIESEVMREYIEKIPTWAIPAIINDDRTGLEDHLVITENSYYSYNDEGRL